MNLDRRMMPTKRTQCSDEWSEGGHHNQNTSNELGILTMDPLQQMLNMATREGLLTPIGANLIKMHTSLYADDAVLFLRPIC
jgi:hypothetical protein